MRSPEIRRGLVAGAVAGGVLVALMYLFESLLGLRPLPQLLQQPILDLMPGAVFGFLIDNLQHAGKVVEEGSLVVAMIAGLAVLGGIYGYLRLRRPLPRLAMIVGAAGWLVVTGVLLPASGDGWFGLFESLITPLLWAVLFLVYAVILEGAYDNWLVVPSEVADPGRRQMLRTVPLAIAGGSLLLLGFELVPRWYKAIFMAPSGGPTAELTPVGDFYVVSKNFTDPIVDPAAWTLTIHGLVDKPQHLKLDDLRRLTAVSEYVTLECISNNVGGYQISTGLFAGPSLGSRPGRGPGGGDPGCLPVAGRVHREPSAGPGSPVTGDPARPHPRRRPTARRPWLPGPGPGARSLRHEGSEVARGHRARDRLSQRVLGEPGLEPGCRGEDDVAHRLAAGGVAAQGRFDRRVRRRLRRQARDQRGRGQRRRRS
jgi:hypothetical protein